MDTGKRFCPYCGDELGVRVDGGRSRPYCSREERFLYENPIPAATALITDRGNRILLVLRNREPGRGEWALPGGFVETGESPAEAARRELAEETGLEAAEPLIIDIIHQESDFYRTSLLIIGYRFARFDGTVRAGDDADEVRFFGPDELPPLAFESHRLIIERYLSARGARSGQDRSHHDRRE
jgi:8-oxo-dGTP diphosphatase